MSIPEIDMNKLILGFGATVFTAVTLWMGSTVQGMSEEIARMSATIEQQVKTIDIYQVDNRDLRLQIADLRDRVIRLESE